MTLFSRTLRCQAAFRRFPVELSSPGAPGTFNNIRKLSQTFSRTSCRAPVEAVAVRGKMNNNNYPLDYSRGGIKEFNQRFLDSAARGDLAEISGLLGAVDINVKSERGWTALMFAARNGQTHVISILIERGCDVNCLNASGQTALEIARFWNHSEAASVLSQHKQGVEFDQIHNYFSLNPLYRASEMRKDTAGLQAAKNNMSTKFVLFSDQKPFLLRSEEPSRKYKFAVFNINQLGTELLERGTVIFLGLETWDPDSNAWFAVDIKEELSDIGPKFFPEGKYATPFPVTMQMEPTQAGIFAEAHSVLCWLDKYKFCSTCGSATKIAEGGYKRVCQNWECSSNKGVQNTCYPRVDPSLIMLVVSPDKKDCLLGRQKRFPPKMYSCLAGFMEPGECLEDTCRREVEEESGIKVGRVDYHSSQPWPFPAVLMLGCIAYARTSALKVDTSELEEARWFSRAEVAQMLAGQHPHGLYVPPGEAIAHQLIKSWVASSFSNL
ncbi:peroxisomal NADH pyrophosphatase NUDT12 isoform X2 [Aplysia californica]|uniref:NAD-capped RNA hydrolase NUDT12 n=1 Tax=Aplysia californica TaxID=6500 RepID=A0ABM0JIE6_APLCA|nr:peroxisomal NADH pyrophosphatase NUDT12 isoform X2 [Aplysia californica]